MIKEAIGKLVEGKNLTVEEARGAMEEIMGGNATPAQIGAYITALRIKGETVDEIAASAQVMREKALRLKIKMPALSLDRDEINVDRETIIDTCGTGGDGTRTFNISTATAFVAAGGGLTVAKHGNRSVSSLCGSADVLRALGVNIDIPPEKVRECVEKIGIGFLFAPLYHSAMKFAIGPRQEIGIRTIFNILGPLTNPAGAQVQVLGVYKPELTEVMAKVLGKLGSRAAMVVYGEGSYDELSIVGQTRVSELKNGKVRTYSLCPEDLGLKTRKPASIRGGDAGENAGIITDILSGASGPRREVTLLNAAAAFKVAGLCKNLKDGIKKAEDSIDSGSAAKKLELLIQVTNS